MDIPILAIGRNGAAADDYQVDKHASFLAHQTSVTFDFVATDDNDDDDGQSVQLTFGPLPPGISTHANQSTTVNIIDNEELTVYFGSSSLDITEGQQAEVSVRLSQSTDDEVSIPLVARQLGGTSAMDYSGVPESISFPVGEIEAKFTIVATDDDVDDDGESLLLEFGDLPAGVKSGIGIAQMTVLLGDDDGPASVEANFVQSAYYVREGESVTVGLELSDYPERRLEIVLSATLLEGAAATDYSFSSTVAFEPDERRASTDFSATADSNDDDGEQVRLGFATLPAGVVSGGASQTTVTINEQRVFITNLGQTTSVAADLASSGTLSPQRVGFVTGNHPTGYELHSVRVLMSFEGVSNSGVPADVVAPLTTRLLKGSVEVAQLTVPSGALNDVATFTALADTKLLPGVQYHVELRFDDDPERDVRIPLTRSSDTDPGSDPEWDLDMSGGARLQIEVRGAPRTIPAADLSFAEESYEVSEGEAVDVSLSLSRNPDRIVAVPITVSRQAGASIEDYSVTPQIVTFEPGETVANFTITAVQDLEDDDGESLLLGFGVLPDGISGTSPTTAEVSIVDDDVTPVLVSTLNLSGRYDHNVGERTELAQRFTTGTSRAGFELRSVSVRLGVFRRLNSGQVIPRDSQVSVWSAAEDVNGNHLPHRRLFRLSDPSGGEVENAVNVFTAPEGSLLRPRTVYAVLFADSGRAFDSSKMEVTDTSGYDDGGQVEGWSMEEFMLRRNPRETTTWSSVANYRVAMSVSGLPRNDWLVEFTQDAHLVFEGGATVVGLRLDDAADRDFTVPIVAIPEGGASAADYSLPESVTFEEGKVEASFTLTAIADGVSDPGESVRLSLGSLPEALSPGGRAETVVSIFDGLVVRAGFVEESFAGAEGDTVRVRVGLSQDPGREVTIPIVATPQDGASEDDYSGLPESRDLPARRDRGELPADGDRRRRGRRRRVAAAGAWRVADRRHDRHRQRPDNGAAGR